MASGCLCLGTDVSGINEIICNGYNGILSKTTSVDSIYDALMKASSSNDKEMLIQNGISFIKNNCALNNIAKNEFKIFEQLNNAK